MHSYDAILPTTFPEQKDVDKDLERHHLTVNEWIRFRLIGELPDRVRLDNELSANQQLALSRLPRNIESNSIMRLTDRQELMICLDKIRSQCLEADNDEELLSLVRLFSDSIIDANNNSLYQSLDNQSILSIQQRVEEIFTHIESDCRTNTNLHRQTIMIHSLVFLCELPLEIQNLETFKIRFGLIRNLIYRSNLELLTVLVENKISKASELAILEIERMCARFTAEGRHTEAWQNFVPVIFDYTLFVFHSKKFNQAEKKLRLITQLFSELDPSSILFQSKQILDQLIFTLHTEIDDKVVLMLNHDLIEQVAKTITAFSRKTPIDAKNRNMILEIFRKIYRARIEGFDKRVDYVRDAIKGTCNVYGIDYDEEIVK